jgi:hypothetical protein
MNQQAQSPARAALAAHHDAMNKLRADIAHCQLVATRLTAPKNWAANEAALADGVAARNREIVRGWLASALAGDTADVPLEALELDDASEERLAEWQRIMEAVEPALADLRAKQGAAVNRLMAAEQELPALIDAVLAEEAQAIAADMERHVEAVQKASARLEAVRQHVARNKSFKLLEHMPRGFGGVAWDRPQATAAALLWSQYANALTSNPNASLQEAKL